MNDPAKVFVKYDLDKDGFITLEETMQNLDLIQRKYKLLFGLWPLKSYLGFFGIWLKTFVFRAMNMYKFLQEKT